jgi:hypothetical protein
MLWMADGNELNGASRPEPSDTALRQVPATGNIPREMAIVAVP